MYNVFFVVFSGVVVVHILRVFSVFGGLRYGKTGLNVWCFPDTLQSFEKQVLI